MLGKKGYQTAFTLIELSIVIVIIGIIAGGILVGQNLIHTAELRSVIVDEQKYITAVNTFRTKYNALPGDMVNATDYWGTDPNGCPNLSIWYTTPQIKTCNGNSDGFINNDGTGDNHDPTVTNYNQMFENFRAWQQLSNAGLIEGSYTGTPGPNNWEHNQPGLNIPASKIQGAGFEWGVYNGASTANYSPDWNADFNKQYLIFGSNVGGTAGAEGGDFKDLTLPILKPLDAMAIDKKTDDGLPYSGTIVAPNIYTGYDTCAKDYGDTNQYDTSVTVLACSLWFKVNNQ